MAITYGSFQFANVASGATITINKPSGVVAGSLLIAQVVSFPTGVTWNDDDGTWTGPIATSGRGATFWKIAGGSEPASYGFTRTSSTNAARGVITRWEGHDLTTPIQDSAGADDATANADSPTVTAANANSVLFCTVLNAASNASAVTAPAGMTQVFQDNTTAFKAGASLGVGAGATGVKTWTSPLATSHAASVVINPQTSQTVSPGGINSAATVGSPTVTSSLTLSPGGINSAATVGTPTVTPGSVTVSPGGINSGATVGTPTVQPGPVTVSPGGIDSTATVGQPTVTSSLTISPAGIDSTATVGTPTVTPGSFTVSPGGIDSSATVGTPTVVPGTVTVSPTGIDSTALLGVPTIIPGAFTVEPPGIDSTITVGTPTVTAAAFTVSPGGINSSATVGTPSVEAELVVSGVVRNHETGDPVGAGVVVKLFDDNDVLVASTTTAADGSYVFYRPFGDTGLYWTYVTYDVLGVQYHGVSDRGCPAV